MPESQHLHLDAPVPPDLTRGVDRAGNERRAAGFAESLLVDPASLFVVFEGNQPLVRGDDAAPRLAWLDRAGLAARHGAGAPADLPHSFLGRDAAGRGLFAIAAPADAPPPDPVPAAPAIRFGALRTALLGLPPEEAALASHGAALLHWRTQTRFCHVCGHALTADAPGQVLHCAGCGRSHFPRTDAAVIMAVTHRDEDGEDRVLLARSPRFGDRRVLSILAGFVEPGESLEAAVAREVLEEVGVIADQVTYFDSQPWPFPAQLMLGFTAATTDPALTLDPEEIVEAHWLTRAQVAAERDADGVEFQLPGKISIARRMLEAWLHGQT